MKTNKEQAIEILKEFKWLTMGLLFSFVTFLSTVLFLWIWVDWSNLWKIGLTSLIAYCLMTALYHFIKNLIIKELEKEELEKQHKPKSTFEQRLEEARNRKK